MLVTSEISKTRNTEYTKPNEQEHRAQGTILHNALTFCSASEYTS